MRVAIRKWGNSLALRIPKSVADDAVITLGSEVDLRVDDGRLVATPVEGTRVLMQLVSRISEENKHGELSLGPRRGGETW